jgi:hypothetical protein
LGVDAEIVNNQRLPQETDLFVHNASRTTNALNDVAGLRAQQYAYMARVISG